MAAHKRFIAGAICPACQAQDTLALWASTGADANDSADVVECVVCGYKMCRPDTVVDGATVAPQLAQGRIIALFPPK